MFGVEVVITTMNDERKVPEDIVEMGGFHNVKSAVEWAKKTMIGNYDFKKIEIYELKKGDNSQYFLEVVETIENDLKVQ